MRQHFASDLGFVDYCLRLTQRGKQAAARRKWALCSARGWAARAAAPRSTPISTNIIFFSHMCPHRTATDGAHRFKSLKADITSD